MGEGYPDKKIARLLGLSEAGAKSRIRRAFAQTKVHSRAEFVAVSRDLLHEMGFTRHVDGSKECAIASFCAYREYCQAGLPRR